MGGAIPLPLRQNTPEWEAARQSPDYIGASDVPIITGSAPYADRSAYDLWAFKTGQLDALPVDAERQELYDLGHALEPVIDERWKILTGKRTRRVNQTLAHPEHPWAVASLDRVVIGERCIVELKWDPWARYSHAPEGVPPHVLEQVQWQLFVTGYERAEVAVLLGSHVSRFEVAPDRGFQDDLFYVVEQFHQHCVDGTPPPIDGSEATRKAIARLHPDDDGTLMDPTAELVALMRQLREAEPAAAAAIEERDRLKNAIRSALGDHSGSSGDGWSVSFRKTKPRKTTDWKAVANEWCSMISEAPMHVIDEVEQRHTTEGEGSRRLLLKWSEEGSWT